jgi:LysR family glycine cleavage system transcriptional activator
MIKPEPERRRDEKDRPGHAELEMAGTSERDLAVYRRLPPLNALRAFNVAARTGSFTLAAQELQVSQGAVSRQIAHLEQFLGLQLFERHHREVHLTREGADYALAMAAAFEQIVQGTQRLWRNHQNPALRLKIFPTFAIRWLVPRLGNFHGQHPEIDVQITTSMQAAQLDREEIDLTVVRHPSPTRGLVFDPLFEIALLPVCSKQVLNGPPSIRQPKDLCRHVLLHAVNRVDDWQRWCDAVGVTVPIAPGGLQFGSSALVYQAASNGAGVAIAQDKFVDDDLVTGRLVAPFDRRVPTGESYYLVTRQENLSSPAVSAFRNWILCEARKGTNANSVRGKAKTAGTA